MRHIALTVLAAVGATLTVCWLVGQWNYPFAALMYAATIAALCGFEAAYYTREAALLAVRTAVEREDRLP